jgi:hypothetical protein
MAFNFFGFKKRPDIQDVEPKDAALMPLVEPELVLEPAAAPIHEPVSAPELAQIPESAPQTKLEPVLSPVPIEEVTSAQESKPTPDAAPVAVGNQLLATREDVIAAFKIFLGRMPESEEVIATWVGVKPEAILVDFLKSQEFLNHTPKSQFILALAKKVLDDRRKADGTLEGEAAKEGRANS